MNPWKRFYDDFSALMEEEDRIVRQRGLRGWFYGTVIYGESEEFGLWSFASSATESLQARFELLAAEAGIALGSPAGTPPHFYWLDRLFVDLRANHSQYIRIYSEAGGFIERLFENSATYCARLNRQSLEMVMVSSESLSLEPGPANQRAGINARAVADAGEESVRERSERRYAVVTPILATKKWKRNRWATRAGVSKNCVYDYLNGKRDLSPENRQALAEELGLKPEDLPD
jgi:hypothetical protein